MPDAEWPHPAADPAIIDDIHGGDRCPWCGDALRYDEQAVRVRDRERGTVAELAPEDVSIHLVHPNCYREVQRASPGLLRQERDERPLPAYTEVRGDA